MNKKSILYAVVGLLILSSVFLVYQIVGSKVVTPMIKELNSLKTDVEPLKVNNDYFYARSYANLRKNYHELDHAIKNIKSGDLTESEKQNVQSVCTFQIEEAVDKISIAKGYDCISYLQKLKNNENDLFRAIKNSSYSLDVAYKREHAINLAKCIIKDHEQIVSSEIKDLTNHFSGHYKDEVDFLQHLIKLNIDTLSARALYRLSMIHLLGRASSLEEANPNLKQAILEQNEAIKFSRIKPKNVLDVVFTVNEKYAVQSAVAMSSALINSDLDSFYNFYFVMDPNDAITDNSQKRLLSLSNIRNHKVDFITANTDLIPLDLIKQKYTNMPLDLIKRKYSTWPLLAPFRLYLHKLLPNLDSALYLDADLLVLRDLTYFKTINMEDYFVAAAYNAFAPCCNDESRNLSLPHFYINSGVLWFNLENMRTQNATKLVSKILDKELIMPTFDQDLTNLSFEDRIFYISYKWNAIWNFAPGTNNINTKFILHYAGGNGIKPWMVEKDQATGSYKEYWIYRDLLTTYYNF